MLTFRSKVDPEHVARVAQVRRWVHAHLPLPEDAVVMVKELACAESGCPSVETVVAVLSAKDQRKFSVPRSLAEVTEDDVARGCFGVACSAKGGAA
jgi:hypothetical protein